MLDIARRTIAKYRDILKITSSENRRRVFSLKKNGSN
jgi:DNA-directed RNA polymerase specialized sigma54-like protein|tara:strand:- start:744 stop:854 length:111 start_codon:yes stop_codon:yes gene_type:complete